MMSAISTQQLPHEHCREVHLAMAMSLCVVLIAALGTGCTSTSDAPTSLPLPSVPARELLLATQPFPKGWVVGSCAPDCSRSEGETHAERSFYIPGVPGHVLQDVFRLPDVEAAQANFQSYREVDFQTFTLPLEIRYRSPIADEHYLGCGVDEVPACRAIMRYGNYFIAFYFDIDNGKGDGLKIADVEPIVRALDQHVAGRLGILLPTTAPVPTQ